VSDETRTHIRLLVLVVLAFLPAIGLYGIANQTLRERERDRQEEQLRQLARLSTAEYRRMVGESRQLLAALAEFPEIREARQPECQARLESVLRHTPQYTTLSVIGRDGYMACGSLTAEGPLYLGDRAYYLLATTQGRFSVGEYALGRITGKPTVGVAQPMGAPQDMAESGGGSDGDDLENVLAASLDLTGLGRFGVQYELPSATTLTVLDRAGNVLVRRPARTAGGDTVGAQVGPDFPPLRAGPGDALLMATGTDLDGVRRLFAVAPLSTLGDRTPEGFVVVGTTDEQILAAVEGVARRELRLLAVAGVLLLVLTWAFGHYGLVRASRRPVAATE